MKKDLSGLNLEHLTLLLGNYEKELKMVSQKGYSWQETYFISDKISQHINEVQMAISRINPLPTSLSLSLNSI
ncbi:MAG: hypothetical protein NVS1B13_11170 [Flavisolibacter sp.]